LHTLSILLEHLPYLARKSVAVESTFRWHATKLVHPVIGDRGFCFPLSGTIKEKVNIPGGSVVAKLQHARIAFAEFS
jgi:hypothetical protein